MKKIILGLLAFSLLSVSLSGCAKKPKPEDALVAFLDVTKSDEEAEYLDYFDAKVDILETDPAAPTEDTPFLNEEALQTKMTDLWKAFTYEIKLTEVAKDGKTAVITVKLTTVDMSTIFNTFITEYITQAMQLAFSGGTEEQITALAVTILTDKLDNAKIDKERIVEVKMNYNAKEKKWYIEGGNTNETFIDGLTGGMVSTMKQFENMGNHQ